MINGTDKLPYEPHGKKNQKKKKNKLPPFLRIKE